MGVRKAPPARREALGLTTALSTTVRTASSLTLAMCQRVSSLEVLYSRYQCRQLESTARSFEAPREGQGGPCDEAPPLP